MRSQIFSATVLAFSQLVLGQTSTDCDPLDTTCAADPALGKTVTIDFTQGKSSYFTEETGTSITYSEGNGAVFTIDSTGVAQTIYTTDYIFFGKVEFTLRAANGTGIVSSFVMESDDLDEIDLEWLGGNSSEVETNYFGKGNTTSYDRAIYIPVTDVQDTWHTYTIDWTSAYIKWYVDSVLVRTLLYADALDGKNFPQTPMKLKFGNWDGGAADEAAGTVKWAGGYTDLNDAPFIMYLKNITIQDYTTNGTTYTYGDKTGDYTSIIISDNSSTNGNTSYTATSTSSSSTSSSSGSSSSGSSSTSSSASSTATKSEGSITRNVSMVLAVVGLVVGAYVL